MFTCVDENITAVKLILHLSKRRRFFLFWPLGCCTHSQDVTVQRKHRQPPTQISILFTCYMFRPKRTIIIFYKHKLLLTPCSRVLLEKLTGSHLVKKFHTFYGTRRFFTAFTGHRHLPLSSASSIQAMPPHPTSWRTILILSSHLRLGLPSGLFPSRFLTKTLYTPLLSPIGATCPAHLILNLITRTEYRSLSSSLCSFLHSPVPNPS